MAFYPNIRDEVVISLNAVAENLKQDPSYLDRPECPYSNQLKSFFKALANADGQNAVPPVDIFAGEDELIVLDAQIVKVINDLETFGNSLTGDDVTEKMAYFRTKTALIEKLVTLREKVVNIKEVNDFRLTILSFMNEICSKDQITDLMHRLDGVLGTKPDDLL